MHPGGIPRGTPFPGVPANLTSRHEDRGFSVPSWGKHSANRIIHILSVGRIESDRLTCDAWKIGL